MNYFHCLAICWKKSIVLLYCFLTFLGVYIKHFRLANVVYGSAPSLPLPAVDNQHVATSVKEARSAFLLNVVASVHYDLLKLSKII